MVWLLDAAHSFHLSPRYYYYTAILFLTRVDSSSSKVARASGINLLKGSNEREAVCTLITLPDIFNIPRMGVVNWIHLFPFFKIRLRSWYYRLFGYFSRLRFRPAPPPLCPSSCVIILRNFNPPVRYRVRSLLGSIPTSSIRKSHEISNEVTILPTSVPTVPTVSSRETIWLSLIRRLPLLRSDDERSLFSFRWPDSLFLFFFLTRACNWVWDYCKWFRTNSNGSLWLRLEYW